MNCQEPYNINNIDFNNIVYPNSRSNQNKKIILIKYNDRNKLRNFVFQTPTLFNLYKANELNNYSEIEVSLLCKEKSKTNNFINFINNLEEKIKIDATTNYNSWFDINKNTDTINFQKTIRDSDDHKDGTIKIKILNNSEFKTSLQINNNNIKVNQVPEDSWCKMILECYAIWINGNNDFGIFIRPILISFSLKDTYTYKFIEDSDEEQINFPETEVNNNNIFMNFNNKTNKVIYNNSTTQLEVNELVKNLDKNNIETSDFNVVNNLKISENFFNNNSNSSSINDINNSLIDAETSE